ncbi:hypothetical protein [Cytobacillus oceanisediminis]|uniref:hypothetical protein n=1 Tax=Cytobacillus oceanisediminis TaxID=665099 RepID=UPI001FB47455|nr:hypothetical protein [Cytobacillus oceanisediminis]UOE58146.1 hypothetical protein IRB79_26945 [Cytobacillus oceanisediminis]
MGKTGERKKRSDAKVDVKPTVELELYDCVSRISHITNTPMKDVGELVCRNGLYSRKVIEHLSEKFKRNYKFGNTLFVGHPDLFAERTKKRKGPTRRLTMRFTQDVYNDLCELAFAMDTTVSTCASILIESSIKDTEILNEYVTSYVHGELDSNRKKQLKLVLDFIRKENPYEDDITLTQLISYIMDEFMEHGRNLKVAVHNWLDSVTEKE